MASKKIAAAIFFLALAVRVLNAPAILGGRMPRLTPLDDLYHWKRIEFSAAHFPRVLEFDPDRGEHGAFCPWPPLYDLACGAIARVFGMPAVVWIPPVAGAMCAALAALVIARWFGWMAGAAAGVALAVSPFIVTESSVGDIDHHWLEWPLVFAILFSVAAALRRPDRLKPVLTLALAMTLAVFIQVALLPACGLAFLALFASGERRVASAFAIVAVVIAIFRLTRPPGYPDSPWFLGWPHVVLFAAAAIALLVRKWPVVAVIAGAAIPLAALRSLLAGLHFFGGDPWLSTISEFQPVWKGNFQDWLSHAAGFSIGAILVSDLARRAINHHRDMEHKETCPLCLCGDKTAAAIALFAIVYLPLAITSRRFEATSIPLLTLAAAADAAMILRRNAAMFAAAAIAVVPAVQLAIWMSHPLPPIAPNQQAWIRAAACLRNLPPGRVLAPWPLGHCLDVLGRHAVVIDNFGTMPDPAVFWRATAALQSADPAAYCARAGVRYVVRPDSPGAEFRLVNTTGLDIWEFTDGAR